MDQKYSQETVCDFGTDNIAYFALYIYIYMYIYIYIYIFLNDIIYEYNWFVMFIRYLINYYNGREVSNQFNVGNCDLHPLEYIPHMDLNGLKTDTKMYQMLFYMIFDCFWL